MTNCKFNPKLESSNKTEKSSVLTVGAGQGLSLTNSALKHLTIVAHEDDDTLFINPNIQEAIVRGDTVRTVFLTAGDAGRGQDYWVGRETGAKAAYAHMAQTTNTWTSTTELFAGKTAYVYTLDNKTNISLVFLRFPDGNMEGQGFGTRSGDQEDCNRAGNRSLQGLWQDSTNSYTIPVLGTWRNCSGITYTRAELTASMQAIVSSFEPTDIHATEPSPIWGETHSDHVHAALFVFDAHLKYTKPHTLRIYRDYNVKTENPNLSKKQIDEENETFCQYSPHDPAVGNCASYSGKPWMDRHIYSTSLAFSAVRLQGYQGDCLSPQDEPVTVGSGVALKACSERNSQLWTVGKDGSFKIKDSAFCLSKSSQTVSGNPLATIETCNGSDAQQWTLTTDGMLRTHGAKCLTSYNTAIGIENCRVASDVDNRPVVHPMQNWSSRAGFFKGWLTGTFADSDANGNYGEDISYYGTIRLGDVSGDGRADICARTKTGITCATSDGSGAFRDPSQFTSEFSDSKGWNEEKYATTLMLGDINGDGRADVCGRGKAGILCALAGASGKSFASSASLWTSSFSDSEGWSDLLYYPSLSMADINGDGFMDICGRGKEGILCSLNNKNGSFEKSRFWLKDDFSDLLGWNNEKYASTIMFGDINGDGTADICGRGSSDIICATVNKSKTAFENVHAWSFRAPYSDAKGWGSSRFKYRSLRMVDINRDGFSDLCVRGSEGLSCSLSNGYSAFSTPQAFLIHDLTASHGWDKEKYTTTIQFGDINGDGAIDVCGRGSQQILCATNP